MFQCKAHLVMRLIENRISMEFMLQVSWVLLCVCQYFQLGFIFKHVLSFSSLTFCYCLGFQQAPESGQYSLVSEVPESHVEPDASVHSCLPQIHLQRLWQRHRPPHQTVGVSFNAIRSVFADGGRDGGGCSVGNSK